MIIFLDFIKSKLNVTFKYVKFYDWEMNIKRDILVKKIKVKKPIFKFLAPSFYGCIMAVLDVYRRHQA